jgi:hypothetical protein
VDQHFCIRGLIASGTCLSRLPDWRPFFYVLSEELDVMLVKASDVRAMPGRKSDVSDADGWLTSLRTVWCGRRSSRRRISVSSAT